ncbi:hypothetical protein N9942_03345 [Akkermansiaceae bacterium]|nr:hypothetical protein [Akkermansiaceae bacterium]
MDHRVIEISPVDKARRHIDLEVVGPSQPTQDKFSSPAIEARTG